MFRYLIILFLLAFNGHTLSFAQVKGRVKTTFTNPVWDGADPWMTKQGKEYIYCFSRNNSVVVSRSELMTQRGEEKVIWKAPPEGWNSNCVWAPEIHFINGDRR